MDGKIIDKNKIADMLKKLKIDRHGLNANDLLFHTQHALKRQKIDGHIARTVFVVGRDRNLILGIMNRPSGYVILPRIGYANVVYIKEEKQWRVLPIMEGEID